MVMTQIPNTLARIIVELHGETGSEWLENLPSLLEDCAQRWSLTISPPFEALSYNYVAPAVDLDGREVVLKAGVPNPELITEIEALHLFRGEGSVLLLDADPEVGILLLERLSPGNLLSTVKDDQQATSIAVKVMQQLWRAPPPTHPFPTVEKWAAGLKRLRRAFDGGSGPFPQALIETAEALLEELIASSDKPVLLHGDLHHGNILSARRQPWLALDPKGVVGEAAYEVGSLLRNPMPELLHAPHPRRLLARRVDQLAEELGFERERLVNWGLAQAVLSAWWSYEDHGHGWEPGITCAEHLAALLG
jgi:streptomycin 6-kinase